MKKKYAEDDVEGHKKRRAIDDETDVEGHKKVK